MDARCQTDCNLWKAVPVSLLAYVCLFFPNPSFTFTEGTNHLTAFFLGVSIYAAALMLTARGNKGHALFFLDFLGFARWTMSLMPQIMAHALFCLGFLGLLLSKEPNVAFAFPLLVFYWCLAIVKGWPKMYLLVVFALTAALSVVLWRITIAAKMAEAKGLYYISNSPILDRVTENAPIILKGLLQYEVSAAITAVFAFLLLALVVAAIAKIRRRGIDGELAFIFLLFGEFASMFVALSISFGVVPRYWAVLIPLFAFLLAFSAKFLLEAVKRNRAFANCTAMALTIFVGFFVSSNYYDFLHQFINTHSVRNLDDSVMSQIASLLNNGEYVQANPHDWGMEQVKSLNSDYNHKKYWPDSPYGNDSIHKASPSNPQQSYYILDFMGKPCANEVHGVHANLIARKDYGVLGYAAKLSGFLQGKAPHTTINYIAGPSALGDYRWVIYAISNRMGDCAPCLRRAYYSRHGIQSEPNEMIPPDCTRWP